MDNLAEKTELSKSMEEDGLGISDSVGSSLPLGGGMVDVESRIVVVNTLSEAL